MKLVELLDALFSNFLLVNSCYCGCMLGELVIIGGNGGSREMYSYLVL